MSSLILLIQVSVIFLFLPACINSGATRQALVHPERFSIKDRGLIAVKGKGHMNTYFVAAAGELDADDITSAGEGATDGQHHAIDN